jgi:hypothetical protein
MTLLSRLRVEGADRLRKHYSLGMWELCSEAADEIDRLEKIEKAAKALRYAMRRNDVYSAGDLQAAIEQLDKALSATA